MILKVVYYLGIPDIAITMFNYFEEIKLSIDKNRVDGDLLKKALSEVYIDIYDRFQPWLKKYNPKSQLKLLNALRNKWTSND